MPYGRELLEYPARITLAFVISSYEHRTVSHNSSNTAGLHSRRELSERGTQAAINHFQFVDYKYLDKYNHLYYARTTHSHTHMLTTHHQRTLIPPTRTTHHLHTRTPPTHSTSYTLTHTPPPTHSHTPPTHLHTHTTSYTLTHPHIHTHHLLHTHTHTTHTHHLLHTHTHTTSYTLTHHLLHTHAHHHTHHLLHTHHE
jgi:hypothetical protein